MKAIRLLIEQFSSAFKTKDWHLLQSVLDDEIIVDYRDVNGLQGKIKSTEYIQHIKNRFDKVDVSILLTPLKIGINKNKALCKAYTIIYRVDRFLYYNSHADYIFGFVETKGSWKIRSIKQNIIWNDGKLKI